MIIKCVTDCNCDCKILQCQQQPNIEKKSSFATIVIANHLIYQHKYLYNWSKIVIVRLNSRIPFPLPLIKFGYSKLKENYNLDPKLQGQERDNFVLFCFREILAMEGCYGTSLTIRTSTNSAASKVPLCSFQISQSLCMCLSLLTNDVLQPFGT